MDPSPMKSELFTPFERQGYRGRTKFDTLGDGDAEFFHSLVVNEVINNGLSSYINIPGNLFGDYGEQQVLIIRDAYNEILPYVQARWGKSITVVTGTPGIGKTYLGAWHLRLLVRDALSNNNNERIIAYQKKGVVYVFTWDSAQKESLGLEHCLLKSTASGKALWCGISTTSDAPDIVRKLLKDKTCYMIADPQDSDKTIVENVAKDGNLVVYASHGHPVMKDFARKKPVLVDSNTFVLPGWSEAEIKAHRNLLQVSGGGEIPEEEVQERLFVAGKTVRFAVAPDINRVKQIIDSKINDIVQLKRWNLMEDVFSTDFKASLVSLDIPSYEYKISAHERSKSEEEGHSESQAGFGSTKGVTEATQAAGEKGDAPDAGSKANKAENKKQGSHSDATHKVHFHRQQVSSPQGHGKESVAKTAGDAVQDQDGDVPDGDTKRHTDAAIATNPFSHDKAVLTHMSDYVIKQLEEKLKTFTADEIGAMAESWATHGYMSVFGALFERNSHLELQRGHSLSLFAVTPTGTSAQRIGTLEVPKANKIVLLHGNDPTRLASMALEEGSHVRPVNSNFPTYDLFVVAGTSTLCFEQQEGDDDELTSHGTGTTSKRAARTGDGDTAPWKKMKYGEDDLLALALQCIVSGASGVPPRLKHKVYHNIVTKSALACREANPQIADLCTVFVVPPICADRFVYQIPQTTKDKDVALKNMPKVQFVAALKTRYSEGFESMVRQREEADEKRRREAAITIDSQTL